MGKFSYLLCCIFEMLINGVVDHIDVRACIQKEAQALVLYLYENEREIGSFQSVGERER